MRYTGHNRDVGVRRWSYINSEGHKYITLPELLSDIESYRAYRVGVEAR